MVPVDTLGNLWITPRCELRIRTCATSVHPHGWRGVSGRVRERLASHYPVRVGDEIIGVGVVVLDITDRVRAEEFRSVVMSHVADGVYTKMLGDHGVVPGIVRRHPGHRSGPDVGPGGGLR